MKMTDTYALGLWAILDYLTRVESELGSALATNGGQDFILPSPSAQLDTGANLAFESIRLKRAHEYATELGMYNSRQLAGELLTTCGMGPENQPTWAISAVDFRKRCDRLFHALKHDLAKAQFVFVPSERVEFLKDGFPFRSTTDEDEVDPFGPTVVAQFPSLRSDIEGSSRALGFGLPGAAVFYILRALEGAFRGIELGLGLPKASGNMKGTWGEFRRRMEEEFESRGKQWRNSREGEFYKVVCGNIGTIQIAWRDTTMHVCRDYNLREAKEVFGVVGLAMKHLASHLDQGGNYTP